MSLLHQWVEEYCEAYDVDSTLPHKMIDDENVRRFMTSTRETELTCIACLIAVPTRIFQAGELTLTGYPEDELLMRAYDVMLAYYAPQEVTDDNDSELITSIGVAEDHTVDLVYNNDRVYARKTLSSFDARDEIAHLMALRECEHVVQLRSFDFSGKRGMLFLEPCARSLSRGLPDITLQEAKMQLALGLQCIHSHNIIHFDLKPDNILICGNTLKITDFGLSEDRDEDDLLYWTEKYTVTFRPPELLTILDHRLEPLNFKQDIYALGVVFYYLEKKYQNPSLDEDEYYLASGSILDILEAQNTISPFYLASKGWWTQGYKLMRGPSYANVRTSSLVMKMMNSSPDRRPTIDQVIEMLS